MRCASSQFIEVLGVVIVRADNQHRHHAHVMWHFQIVGDVFEKGGAGGVHRMVGNKLVVGRARGLWDVVGVDNVENAVEQ